MEYSKKVLQAAKAAKISAGIKKVPQVSMTPAELVGFLAGKGVEAHLVPGTIIGQVLRPGGFFRSERWEEVTHAAFGVEIPGVGQIQPFDHFVVYYHEVIKNGKVVILPSSTWVKVEEGGFSRSAEKGEGVEDHLLPLFSSYELELEEEVMVLPIPAWVEERRFDWGTDVGPGMTSVVLFRSDAEQMAAEFAKALALAVPKREDGYYIETRPSGAYSVYCGKHAPLNAAPLGVDPVGFDAECDVCGKTA